MKDEETIRLFLRRGLEQKTCMKRPLSALIETVNGELIQGWNGPPSKGCVHNDCLRKGMPSGEGMHLCPTHHAEQRAINQAAKYGIATSKATMYLGAWFPCKTCALNIIDSGFSKFVTPDELYADKENHTLIASLQNQAYNFEMAESLMRNAGIEIIVNPNIRP